MVHPAQDKENSKEHFKNSEVVTGMNVEVAKADA